MKNNRGNEYGLVRPVRRQRRPVHRFFNKENAVRALEGWGRNRELFGFTKGQFSMVDLLEAILERTGEADVVVSTWTAAARDLQRCLHFLQRDMARRMLWLVDISFERRVPEFALRLKVMFGEEAVRVVPSHCKFILVENADWHVVVQTSMNLNYNPRLENFWVCEDEVFYRAYRDLVEMIFAFQKPGVGFRRMPKAARAEFKFLGAGKEVEDLGLEVTFDDEPTG